MVKIRLRRVGAKKQPKYRVVVADSRSPRDGRFIEVIGHYDPRANPPEVVIHEDRALYWLSVGAQPSDPVARFFDKLGLSAKLKDVHAGAKIEDIAAPRPSAPRAKAKAARAKDEAVAQPAPAEVVAGPLVAETVAAETAGAEAEGVAEGAAAEQIVAEAEGVAEAVAAEPVAGEATVDAAVTDNAPVGALEALGLSARVARTLEAEGIATAAELAARLAEGDDALLGISGIGPKAVEEIRARLAEHGLGV